MIWLPLLPCCLLGNAPVCLWKQAREWGGNWRPSYHALSILGAQVFISSLTVFNPFDKGTELQNREKWETNRLWPKLWSLVFVHLELDFPNLVLLHNPVIQVWMGMATHHYWRCEWSWFQDLHHRYPVGKKCKGEKRTSETWLVLT